MNNTGLETAITQHAVQSAKYTKKIIAMPGYYELLVLPPGILAIAPIYSRVRFTQGWSGNRGEVCSGKYR